eukprot:c17725_g1_i1.p1 GENE.c17725_g1_i1~~c17725_g1_i1.p1  ORF type:complete len:763 (-),score=113.98 c17725_g1_i1:159-2447(-)
MHKACLAVLLVVAHCGLVCGQGVGTRSDILGLNQLVNRLSSMLFPGGSLATENPQFQSLLSIATTPSCQLDCHWRGKCVNGGCQCFHGWGGTLCNEARPWCPQNCLGHGVCSTETFECRCDVGFAGVNCSIVVPQCPMSCLGHGQCDERTGKCMCFLGFAGDDCSIIVQDTCPEQCSGHGDCTHGVCQCAAGFGGSACDRVVPVLTCPNSCSGHGTCNGSKCVCEHGYSGADCSQVLLSTAKTSFGCPDQCSGRGTCVRERCRCAYGWYGRSCNQYYKICPNFCSGHGACAANFSCRCEPGFHGKSCEFADGGDCPANCNGLGVCTFDTLWGFLGSNTHFCKCNAASQVEGDSCSVNSDIVLCPKNCSGHGLCQSGICTCHEGFGGKACDEPLFNCPRNCTGNGFCIHGKCKCLPGWGGQACNIQELRCPRDCSGRGMCHDGQCRCDKAWTGLACNVTCTRNCSRHGHCDHGVCNCFTGWAGELCDRRSRCPNNCNNQGRCEDDVCSCFSGWSGEDCSTEGSDENTLPPSCKDTTLKDCSNHGDCAWSEENKKSFCICKDNWVGIDCSRRVIGEESVVELDYRNCSTVTAINCVSHWVEQGCLANALRPTHCFFFRNCEDQAMRTGRCPLLPSNSNQTSNQSLSLQVCQNDGASCVQTWLTNGCPPSMGGDCQAFNSCIPLVIQNCPRLANTPTPTPMPTPAHSHSFAGGPHAHEPPSCDCSVPPALGCVQLWVDAGCPVDYSHQDECASYAHCTLEKEKCE